MKCFSITDHNVIGDYVDGITPLALKNGICFVQGIEVSTVDRASGISCHILGYSNNFDRGKLNFELAPTVEGYVLRARSIIDKLNNEFEGFNLTYEKARLSPHEAYVTRNGIGIRLAQFLNNGIPLKQLIHDHVFVPEDDSWMINTSQAFSFIQEAGGIPVWAHSGNVLQRVGEDNYRQMVERFSHDGLLGLEVFHPDHSPECSEKLTQIAEEMDLLITGGSDWHGLSFSSNYKAASLPEEALDRFLLNL